MQDIRRSKILLQACTVLLLLPIAACNGSTSTTSTSGSTSTSVSSGASGQGSSAGGGTSSVGSGSSGVTSTTTVLFEQPQVSGIAGHFAVPPATHTAPPQDAFALVLWQPDRFQSKGVPVPTAWDAGSQTGFTPISASGTQLGFRNLVGSSTAQMQEGTVGAYLNSQDLPPSTADQKMMISPEFRFPPGSQPVPFASAQAMLSGALNLQVPTAVGPETYVRADLLFEGQNGVRISYGIGLFRNGKAQNPVVGSGYDAPSNTYMLNSPLGVDQRYLARAADSAVMTGTPWSGWRHFEWSISEAQFANALQYLAAQFPGKLTSTDPSRYVLAEIHLNAEFHTQGQAAELGWSMQGLKVWTTM
jgi:hypothetical protein